MITDRFCIFVPTIRKYTEEFREALFNSLSMPSDVFICDGVNGIIQTYQWALEHILDPVRHTWFCKLDDDLKLHYGWQDECTKALLHVPNLGAVAPSLDVTEEGRDYMGPIKQVYVERDFVLQEPLGNLAGACIVMTADVAFNVGAPPVVEGTKYQFYEDGWRCARVVELGYRIAYLEMTCEQPEILHYTDSPEYNRMRARDIEASKNGKEVWERWVK